jgi:TonB family protein
MLRSPPAHLLSHHLAAILLLALAFSLQAEEPVVPKLPTLKSPHSVVGLFYPERAVRLGQQGRVLVEFAISPKGRPVDVAVTAAEPQGVFNDTVTSYIRALQFDVPTDWEASGAARVKYHISFVFLLRPCREGVPCDDIVQFPADSSVMITRPPLAPAPKH